MNALRFRRTAVAVAAAAVLPFSLAACSDDSGSSSANEASSPSAGAPDADSSPSMSASASGDMMDKPFGDACASLPKSGEGSAEGMADDPVATAASNNPELTTLVAAVKAAGLVDTLNDAEDITVFAPTNDAFKKIPKEDLDKLLADKDQLTKVLTYHVVGETIQPDQLEDGSFTTLEKSKLTTSGSDMKFKVNDSANIVCGNVQTANAKVQLIDTVLMPPAGSPSASAS
ncbi:fasciclin domain-containing protein [Streptomyces sp. NPDC060194]|uniref:fasciclin domain-containing protein n=1 Tax=Streptomyces sp. NPDC060194 TaxID=3347069 RepID=UPI00364676AD